MSSRYDEERAEAVSRWLAARRPAVRKLWLENDSEGLQLAPTLPTPPLPSLAFLHMSQLGFLPAQCAALLGHTGLTRIYMQACNASDGCEFEEPPRGASRLANLQSLDISHCYRSQHSPWRHLDGPSRLTELRLESCGIATVPRGISTLSALRRLYIGGEPTTAGWERLGALRQLTSLTLTRMRHAALPACISRFAGLRELELSANWHVTSWQVLLPLTRLEVLDLGHCNAMTELPAALSCMPRLRSLDLRNCASLAGGWHHLAVHRQLATLNLAGCKLLASLPAEVATLSALQKLFLDESFTCAGFRHLAGLAHLTQVNMLYIGSNRVQDRALQGSAAELAQDVAAARALASKGALQARQLDRLLPPQAK
ncbi:hypothetical protein ABPG75_002154 [Micractinium tetrahymenae]